MIKVIKFKLLAVFPAIVAVLALTATSAFAEFQSNSSSTAGQFKGGEVVLEGGGATLTCTSTAGEWKIQTKGKVTEQEVENKQVKTTKGPHQYIHINTFNGCKAKSSSINEITPTVGPCTLQVAQQPGSFSALGSVATECKVEIKVLFITCKITVPPANEQTGVNFNLQTNTLQNSGNDLNITAADAGITSEAKNCPGVSSTNEAKQKATITEQGVNAV